MKTLLACLDTSVYSASVVDHAAWAAQQLGASVHLLHLLEPVPVTAYQADFSGAIGLDAQSRLKDELVALEQAKARVAAAQAEGLLATARARLAATGLPTARVQSEARHGELVDAVAEFDASHDMVVLGKRGEHVNFAKGHLGSNLERVIRTSRHPVLVAARAFLPIERALLAFDGGPSVRKGIEYLATQPLLRAVEIRLVHVGAASAAVKLELDAARVRLAQTGHHVIVEQAPGDPDEVIPAIVQREKISLLMMGAFGHSRIREFIVGSTTTALIRTCQTPVLLFR